MDEKGIKEADILGFSDGGNVALLFALKHPGMVRRLILNGCLLYTSDFRTRPGYRYGLVQPLPSRETFIVQGRNRLPRPDKMGNLIYLIYV